MSITRFKSLNNRGDTIVEVMVVLAILGLALGISYATANRSLLNARQAEENAQATHYVQSQIEILYNLASSPNALKPGAFGYPGNNDNAGLDPTANDIYSANGMAFCMPQPSVGTNLVFYDPIATPADPNASSCLVNNMYQVAVYYCDGYTTSLVCYGNDANNTDTFIVQVVWPDALGDGTDSVTQTYRIHPGEGFQGG
jgi:prepilin-type N-terminal cleavage/methylation domain-containing protein